MKKDVKKTNEFLIMADCVSLNMRMRTESVHKVIIQQQGPFVSYGNQTGFPFL